MKIKDALRKAFENGFPYGDVTYARVVWHANGTWDFVMANGHQLHTNHDLAINWERFLMNPQFWQSLGKARGWEDEANFGSDESDVVSLGFVGSEYVWFNGDEWKYRWICFIDHLAEGATAETFFETLK